MKSKKILIFTGAGISTNCGIPDFRSSDGLYSYAEEMYNVPYPEAVFDIKYFDKNPEPFFKLSSDILSNRVKPSKTHFFIKTLEDLGKVERIVTQNIDMLHEKAGSSQVLACHGTYSNATCRNCQSYYNYIDIESSILYGEVPYCSCGGIIKPNITFFGESLPVEFYTFYENPPEVDLVIVMGTSLEVSPANQIPLMYKDKAPLIIVNRDKTTYDEYFDYRYLMDCDIFSENMIREINEKNNTC